MNPFLTSAFSLFNTKSKEATAAHLGIVSAEQFAIMCEYYDSLNTEYLSAITTTREHGIYFLLICAAINGEI